MLIYTYSKDSLTMNPSPRLKNIIKKTTSSTEEISQVELNYLINSTAKWDTFKAFIDNAKPTIAVTTFKNRLDLKETLGDLIKESKGV